MSLLPTILTLQLHVQQVGIVITQIKFHCRSKRTIVINKIKKYEITALK